MKDATQVGLKGSQKMFGGGTDEVRGVEGGEGGKEKTESKNRGTAVGARATPDPEK